MFKKETPFRPISTDICPNACHVFYDSNENECPVCGELRMEGNISALKPRRTFQQLEVAPQIASLFKNQEFLNYLDNPIEESIKGDYIRCLKNYHGLFREKYDLAVVLYTDGFQTHNRGGTKLNSVMLQILNIPENKRYYIAF